MDYVLKLVSFSCIVECACHLILTSSVDLIVKRREPQLCAGLSLVSSKA